MIRNENKSRDEVFRIKFLRCCFSDKRLCFVTDDWFPIERQSSSKREKQRKTKNRWVISNFPVADENDQKNRKIASFIDFILVKSFKNINFILFLFIFESRLTCIGICLISVVAFFLVSAIILSLIPLYLSKSVDVLQRTTKFFLKINFRFHIEYFWRNRRISLFGISIRRRCKFDVDRKRNESHWNWTSSKILFFFWQISFIFLLLVKRSIRIDENFFENNKFICSNWIFTTTKYRNQNSLRL